MELDEEGNGVLSNKDFQKILESGNFSIPLDIDQIIQECDASQDGSIHYNEFLTATMDW